jgi:Arc/MetJ family transcription regulator
MTVVKDGLHQARFPRLASQLECVRILRNIHIMRTNIVIDDKLMKDVLKATGIKTKREAVDRALRLLLQIERQQEIRKFRGKLNWEGDLDAMRTDK